MYQFIVILILIVCVLLAGAVLLQNSKGGGLAADLSASTQTFGIRQTANFLEKATWVLAVALVVLSLVSTMTIDRGTVEDNISTEVSTVDMIPTAQPAASTQAPVENVSE